jgi:hypothetical protein
MAAVLSEAQIEGRVVRWAKARDILPLKLTPVADGGWPDHFWLFYAPSIAFIEFKAPGGRVAPRQKLRIAELQRRGYPAEIFNDVDKAITFLERACLSANSSISWDRASMRWVLDESWHGQNHDHLRYLFHPQE